MQKIYITSIASLSPLGHDATEIWNSYTAMKPRFIKHSFNGNLVFAAMLSIENRDLVNQLRDSDSKYRSLDDSVLFAILASRKAVKEADWDKNFGLNMGSSRGATALFEKHYHEFLESGKANTLSSPTTTLGNLSSWVGHDLQQNGPEISHSITCSTALHSLLNGVAWLRSGMSERFLVGGSEAPLTDFTVAQMQALKIYSKEEGAFPSRASDLSKTRNSMILGEGASVCCMEINPSVAPLAEVIGIGYATEILRHGTSISADAECLQKSMKMAIGEIPLSEIDAIVMHSPGTIAGDSTEFNAIKKIFGEQIPMRTTNKWLTGHTFATSGMLNVEMAILMMQHQQFIGTPFITQEIDRPLRKILINAVGFGGNAVSVLLGKI